MPKTTKITNSLKDRLKELRNFHNLSQKEISQFLGIGLRSWQQYETGENIPGGNVLELLYFKLKINLNWLVSGVGFMHCADESDSNMVIKSLEIVTNFVNQQVRK